MHLNSQLLFERYAKELFRPDMRVLEMGPNEIPSTYQTMVGIGSIGWDTLDISHGRAHPSLTFVTDDEYRFPVDSDAYDIVVSGQVIEHVRQIWRWMREVARVCRPGGRVVTICPVTWPYHEDPVDCWRIYPEGMNALLGEAGLEPEVVVCESAEPKLDLRKQKWFLVKQTLKAFIGREPFIGPLVPAHSPTLDTIAIARKKPGN